MINKFLNIFRAKILKSSNRRMQVKLSNEAVVDDVLKLENYGFSSRPKTNELALFLQTSSQKGNLYAIPYNETKRPILEETEVAVGNFETKNKITFKKDGTIEITGSKRFLLEATDKVFLANNATEIQIGPATAYALNMNAQMQVVIPSGSSAGTYQVQIIQAGQNITKI